MIQLTQRHSAWPSFRETYEPKRNWPAIEAASPSTKGARGVAGYRPTSVGVHLAGEQQPGMSCHRMLKVFLDLPGILKHIHGNYEERCDLFVTCFSSWINLTILWNT